MTLSGCLTEEFWRQLSRGIRVQDAFTKALNVAKSCPFDSDSDANAQKCDENHANCAYRFSYYRSDQYAQYVALYNQGCEDDPL